MAAIQSAGTQPQTCQNRRELHRLLQPLQVDTCPFANLPNAKRKSITGGGITAEDMKEIQWVAPRLVAQVDFLAWTPGGNIRHDSRHSVSPSLVRTGSPCRGLNHQVVYERRDRLRVALHLQQHVVLPIGSQAPDVGSVLENVVIARLMQAE